MLSILLAAYNEEKDLATLLRQIEEQHWGFPYRVVIINDGSTDATRDVAKSFISKLPVTLIDHERNRGLGVALMTGFTAIAPTMTASDVLVTMDADATHPPALVPELKQQVDAGADLAIASRFCRGGSQAGLSLVRRMLSAGAGAVFSLLRPITGVRDYTSGYRAYSGGLTGKLFERYGTCLIEERGFAATLELLLKASLLARTIVEVPLPLDYGKKTGVSKMRILKTIVSDLQVLFRVHRTLTK